MAKIAPPNNQPQGNWFFQNPQAPPPSWKKVAKKSGLNQKALKPKLTAAKIRLRPKTCCQRPGFSVSSPKTTANDNNNNPQAPTELVNNTKAVKTLPNNNCHLFPRRKNLIKNKAARGKN